LDWVAKRAACNLAAIYHQLCLEIDNDIIAVNALRDDKEMHFRRDSLADGSIVIGQPQRIPRVTVTIGIVDQTILVRNQAAQEQWSAMVGLSNECRCVLRLVQDKSELETWQFRKKALDALFFVI